VSGSARVGRGTAIPAFGNQGFHERADPKAVTAGRTRDSHLRDWFEPLDRNERRVQTLRGRSAVDWGLPQFRILPGGGLVEHSPGC
jgi:hypothetical protein